MAIPYRQTSVRARDVYSDVFGGMGGATAGVALIRANTVGFKSHAPPESRPRARPVCTSPSAFRRFVTGKFAANGISIIDNRKTKKKKKNCPINCFTNDSRFRHQPTDDEMWTIRRHRNWIFFFFFLCNILSSPALVFAGYRSAREIRWVPTSYILLLS